MRPRGYSLEGKKPTYLKKNRGLLHRFEGRKRGGHRREKRGVAQRRRGPTQWKLQKAAIPPHFRPDKSTESPSEQILLPKKGKRKDFDDLRNMARKRKS